MSGYDWNEVKAHLELLVRLKQEGKLSLTRRERTLIHSLVRGLTDSEIAEGQGITENTVEVETQMRMLRDKFGATDRGQLLLFVRVVFPEEFFDRDGKLISGSAVF